MKPRWISRAKKAERRYLMRHRKARIPWLRPNNYEVMKYYKKLATNTALYDPPDNPNPEEILLEREMREQINAALLDIPARAERVIRLWYGLDGNPRTLEQVSEHMGVTRERIRQIAGKACRQLRHPSRGLRPFKDKYRWRWSCHFERIERENEAKREEQRAQYLIGTALPSPPPKRVWRAPILINVGSNPYVQPVRQRVSLEDRDVYRDVLRDILIKALIERGLA